MTLFFLFVSTDPAVAVTDNGSPGYTAGALALHDNVIGGAFLQPMGKTAKQTAVKSRQTNFRARKFMSFSFTIMQSTGNISFSGG